MPSFTALTQSARRCVTVNKPKVIVWPARFDIQLHLSTQWPALLIPVRFKLFRVFSNFRKVLIRTSKHSNFERFEQFKQFAKRFSEHLWGRLLLLQFRWPVLSAKESSSRSKLFVTFELSASGHYSKQSKHKNENNQHVTVAQIVRISQAFFSIQVVLWDGFPLLAQVQGHTQCELSNFETQTKSSAHDFEMLRFNFPSSKTFRMSRRGTFQREEDHSPWSTGPFSLDFWQNYSWTIVL